MCGVSQSNLVSEGGALSRLSEIAELDSDWTRPSPFHCPSHTLEAIFSNKQV